jgi:hypothetical protein
MPPRRNDAATTPQRRRNDAATTPQRRRNDAVTTLVILQIYDSDDSLVFDNLVRWQCKPCSLAELGWPSNMMCLHARDANSHNGTRNNATDTM